MQRGSNRLSVHKDEEMKHELQGLLRSGHPTRAEEWHDVEPAADDDPDIASGPIGAWEFLQPAHTLETELGRHLGRTAFPATRVDLVRILTERHAPDRLIRMVNALPAQGSYTSAAEIIRTLARQSR
ncbi:DUF2795 domain-containing protein [Streptomyces sp. PR69]|uniref:DUF2795 domain-containing protein n=1 Tax=Streptomyces sp. PR69 TaxID=2984950 RepID=UPI0022647CA2|nr:DUF2795 domain-containing protein [Streptomyces sp. PR69]